MTKNAWKQSADSIVVCIYFIQWLDRTQTNRAGLEKKVSIRASSSVILHSYSWVSSQGAGIRALTMNRMSQLRGGTSGKGKITLFTHEDFEGASLEIEDSNMQIQKLWPHDRIRSVIVQGNPWVLFEEPGFWVSKNPLLQLPLAKEHKTRGIPAKMGIIDAQKRRT